MMAKRRSPGDGGLWKRADGLWVGSVEVPSPDGRRRQKRVYSTNFREARRKLGELQAKVQQGLIVHTQASTVEDWLRHWLEDIKRPHITQSTYRFYEEAIRLHIVPVIGRVRLDKLTAQHVHHVINSANTTRNAQRAHLVLNMAMDKAVDHGILGRNVVASVDKPAHRKRTQDHLELEQAKHLIKTAIDLQERPGYRGPLLATRWAAALWTGARPAELRGLEWNRVDLDNSIFDLSWQLKQLDKSHGCGEQQPDGSWPCGRKRPSYCPDARWNLPPVMEWRECRGSLVWVRPKTEAGRRIVPIVEPLREMLLIHRQDTAGDPNPHGLVWAHRDGRPIGEKQEWQLWRQLLDAAELPRVDQYATRHTTATLLDALGVSEDVRMQIMGHSSKVAHRAYMHVDQTRARAALDKLAEIMQ